MAEAASVPPGSLLQSHACSICLFAFAVEFIAIITAAGFWLLQGTLLSLSI